MTTIDWHRDRLTPETRIGNEYRSTQNVRRFFQAHIGQHFRFTIDFMLWMRTNPAMSLGAAVREWKRRYE